MKIDVICNDGSPLGITEKTMRGEDGRLGVGGAELALLTMCSAWKFYGNEVTLYNDPKELGASSFEQLPLTSFEPYSNRDILIIFRSPNERSRSARGKKIWWSCDQMTVGDFREFAKSVQKVVTISKFHSGYFKAMYGIDDTVSIDLPVRTWEYKDKVEKIPKRCVFTSIPDRGVMNLHAAWPLIVRDVPDASLVITSDWRLWTDWANEEMIQTYRLSYAHHPNVTYLGAVKRDRLIQAQMEAQLLLYPCVYEELFCIACAEAQVAGALPVTSEFGALSTTNMAMLLSGNPFDPSWIENFAKKTVGLLNDPQLEGKQNHIKEVAIKRFSVENIVKQWDEVFNA